MRYKLATALLVVAALVVATLTATTATTTRRAQAATGDFPVNGCPPDSVATKPPCDGDDVVLRWNEQLLQTIRDTPMGTGPTVTARALGELHTAIYDAWSAYDLAKATLKNGNTEQRGAEVNDTNKSKAIDFAAYKTLVDLFPFRQSTYADQMMKPIYGDNFAADPSAPATVGNNAAQAVITYRHADGSNQTQPPSPSGKVTYPQLPCTPSPTIPCPYTPKAPFGQPTVQWHWQPLCVPLPPSDATTCDSPSAVQNPLTPQWGNVKSFSSLAALELKVNPPAKTTTDIDTALADTNLSGPDIDRKKVTAEYWADGGGTAFPPGHMAAFAQYMCRKKGNNLDTDVKFFFTLGNALMDASIASWWEKYKYDWWRPITAIRNLYYGKWVTSWLGPGVDPAHGNFGTVLGQDWKPYQEANVVTPPFPEYVSGHSTFSAAGNVVLVGFTGSDNFGGSVTISKYLTDGITYWSKIEPGTPASPVTLTWPTFTAAADEAGWSRRYGGIHFKTGDVQGRSLGNMVGQNVWSKAQSYFRGTIGYDT
jgi:hypothetical protein